MPLPCPPTVINVYSPLPQCSGCAEDMEFSSRHIFKRFIFELSRDVMQCTQKVQFVPAESAAMREARMHRELLLLTSLASAGDAVLPCSQ
jgi:hypothetical protein